MKQTTRRLNQVQLWSFRALAVVFALLPFALVELTLRAAGWPKQPPPLDPYLELHNLQPLFINGDQPGELHIGADRLELFRPASFNRDKSLDTFRCFALGGSTTQGEPYSTETAFPEWMRINLQAAQPNKKVEVINCGGLSYASYRVLKIIAEVLEYEPDLIVVYTGQNEYLERRSYADYHEATFFNGAVGWLSQWRLVQGTRSLLGYQAGRTGLAGGEKTELTREVEALLDFQGGLEEYHRGDAWYQPVPAHFQWNLERIIETCAIKQVPLILFRPVTNLLDCPPMKFEADPSLPADRLQELNIQWQEAQSSLQSPERSTHHLEAVLEIDPDHAGAHFLLGRLQYQQGDYPAALKSLTRARDTDVCPLRATSDILGRIETVAAEHGIPLVDAEELLADLSPHGIVGNKVLVDHIHPTIEGHQILGEAAAQLCISQGIVDSPVANWQSVRKEMYREHLDSLGEAYFHRGKQRLEGLILWTQGRAKKIRDSH